MKIGDKQRASEIFGTIKSIDKKAKGAEAYNLWMEGKYQESFDLLEEEEKLTSSTSKWSLYFRGYLQGEFLNNDELAIDFYKRAINYNNNFDDIWQKTIDQLAITYARNGRALDAVELWKSILPFSENPEKIKSKIDFVNKKLKPSS